MHITTSYVEIESALNYISSDTSRDDWWRIIAAIKTVLGEPGKELARQWSQQSDKYGTADFEATWRSLQPGLIGLGTLLHHAKSNGYSISAKKLGRPLHVAKPLYMATQSNTKSPTFNYAKTIWERLNIFDPLQALPIAPARLDQYVASHPYCRSRGISAAAGAARGKVSSRRLGQQADCIVVPYFSYPDEELVGIECINAEGTKQAFGNKGILILGNDLDNTLPQQVFEGWSTAARFVADHERNACAYIAGGNGKLREVAELIRKNTGRQVLIRSEVD